MSRLLLLVIVLLLGLVVGPMIAGSPGYVLVRAGGQTIEMTLVTLVVMVVAGIVLLWALEIGLRALLRFPSWAGHWRERRRVQRRRQREENGVLRLLAGDAEGCWRDLGGVSGQSRRLAVRVAAIVAARQLGKHDEADALEASLPEDAAPAWLVLARTALVQDDVAFAARYLEKIEARQRDTTYALLEEAIARRSGNWQRLAEMLPQLKRTKAVTGEALSELQLQVHEAEIRARTSKEGAQAGMAYLRQLPRQWRHEPALLVAAAAPLAAQGDANATKALGEAIRSTDDPAILERIAALPHLPAEALILDAKKALKAKGESPQRLNLLAVLCQQAGREGEARAFRQQASSH